MIDMTRPGMALIFSTVGTRYWWGKGNLTTPLVEILQGADCSGYAMVMLREIGIVRPDAWFDTTATELANACDPVATNLADLGDLVFYGTGSGDRPVTHVMVYIGDGMVIGASGGNSKTKGNDPNAVVQVRPAGYRKDLLVIGRLKSEFRLRGPR